MLNLNLFIKQILIAISMSMIITILAVSTTSCVVSNKTDNSDASIENVTLTPKFTPTPEPTPTLESVIKGYSMLTNFEKQQYVNIKTYIDKNDVYRMDLQSVLSEPMDDIHYDFNCDSAVETLSVSFSGNPDGTSDEATPQKVTFSMNGQEISRLTNDHGVWGQYSEFGIMDVNKNDSYIEFYIIEGTVGGGDVTIYRVMDKARIAEIAVFNGGIEAVSGDGKIYYWGGNLLEVFNKPFNPNMVLSYYDINKGEFVDTDQIIGKTVATPEQIIVYKTEQDIYNGQYPPDIDEFTKEEKEKIVTLLEDGEMFTVLSLGNDDIAKVKTSEGQTG